jgi:hypothetical protein
MRSLTVMREPYRIAAPGAKPHLRKPALAVCQPQTY